MNLQEMAIKAREEADQLEAEAAQAEAQAEGGMSITPEAYALINILADRSMLLVAALLYNNGKVSMREASDDAFILLDEFQKATQDWNVRKRAEFEAVTAPTSVVEESDPED